MLLQQLACSPAAVTAGQLVPVFPVSFTWLHCGKRGCREFLQCQACSCFLYKLPSLPDIHYILGIHCNIEGCREFLKCKTQSEALCSCFLHKEMKAFSCPNEYFVVSQSGISDLHLATSFYCKRNLGTDMVPLSPAAEFFTSVIIIGKPLAGDRSYISLRNYICTAYDLDISFSPKKKVTFNEGTPASMAAKTFPFKLGRKFEMNLLFLADGFEVRVDGKDLASGMLPKLECYIKEMEHLTLRGIEAESVHLKYET